MIAKLLISLVVLYLLACVLAGCAQRRLIYFPTRESSEAIGRRSGLAPWLVDGQLIGFCRTVSAPSRIWLMFHGNGGQAAHRDYVLPLLSATDSFYALEYPGYGERPGKPSRESLNGAAEDAYRLLRQQFPGVEICVMGESLGSGPACHVATLSPAPDRLALFVPFGRMTDLAQESFRLLPARLILLDRWDNVEALSRYDGRIDIYGAKDDRVIPVHHARRLADSKPSAQYHELAGGHNDWSRAAGIDLR